MVELIADRSQRHHADAVVGYILSVIGIIVPADSIDKELGGVDVGSDAQIDQTATIVAGQIVLDISGALFCKFKDSVHLARRIVVIGGLPIGIRIVAGTIFARRIIGD